MEELKPCPFCGSEKVKLIRPQVISGEYVYGVTCVNCEIGINRNGFMFFSDWKEATAAWNRRVDDGK